jgi:hypothetical protein
LIASSWKSKSSFLRTAIITVGLPLLVSHFIMGYPVETRVFMEIYAVIILLIFNRFLI